MHRDRAQRLTVLLAVLALITGCSSTTPLATPAATPLREPRPTAPIETAPAAPSPSTTPARVQPTPAPTATPALRWKRVGTLRMPADGGDSPLVLVGWTDGYLAMYDWDTRAWYSRDGSRWERVKLPAAPLPLGVVRGRGFPDPVITAGTTNGRQVLLTGRQEHEPCSVEEPYRTLACSYSPVSWITADGRNWRVSPPGEGPDAYNFDAAWPVPGGWEAFAPYFEGDAVALGTDVYRSPDGLHWSLSDQLPLETDTDLFVLSSGTTRVAVVDHPGDDGFEQSGWISTRQGPWTRIPSSAISGGVLPGVAPLPGGPDVWVLNGYWSVLTSRNLVDWTEHVLLTDQNQCGVSGIAASPLLGIVAVAHQCGSMDTDGHTWLSRDGNTWEQLPTPSSLSAVADGPDGIVALGTPDGDGVVAVWRLVPSLPKRHAL
jgi:hypothetical protein